MTTTDSPAVQRCHDSQREFDGGAPELHDGQFHLDTQEPAAVVDPTPRPTNVRPTANEAASGGVQAGDGHCSIDAHVAYAVAPSIHDGHSFSDAQGGCVVVDPTPRPTKNRPDITDDASGGVQAGDGQVTGDAQVLSAVAPNIRSDQRSSDTHDGGVTAEQSPRPTNQATAPIVASSDGDQAGDGQGAYDAHSEPAVASTPPAPATSWPIPKTAAPVLADPVLALAADILDDVERVRIANENRLRQLTRAETDSDGVDRGLGIPADHPMVAATTKLVEESLTLEQHAQKNLEQLLKRHPLGPWVKRTHGVGPKQGARLIAAIGDPYWNDKYNRPRTVSELWAYCGYHVLPAGHRSVDTQARGASGTQTRADQESVDPQRADVSPTYSPAGQPSDDTQHAIAGGTQTGGHPDQRSPDTQKGGVGVAAARKRGAKVNWSPKAKMRTYLVAEKCVQTGKAADSPYYRVYRNGREKYAEAVHKVECVRCGPQGKPAPVGSPLSDGHKHARALRLVAKEILKDLWKEAARLHGARPDEDSAAAGAIPRSMPSAMTPQLPSPSTEEVA